MNPVAVLREVLQAHQGPILALCVVPRDGGRSRSWTLAVAQLEPLGQDGVQLTFREAWSLVYWNRDKALARAIAEAYAREWLVFDEDLQFGSPLSEEAAAKILNTPMLRWVVRHEDAARAPLQAWLDQQPYVSLSGGVVGAAPHVRHRA